MYRGSNRFPMLNMIYSARMEPFCMHGWTKSYTDIYLLI